MVKRLIKGMQNRKEIIFLFRKVFFRVLYFAGIGHLLRYSNQKKGLVPILLFHRVSDETDIYWPPLTNKAFRRIIRFFRDKYEFLSLNDLFTINHTNLRKACFIVFDDAYKDFQENALPILKENNIPVTMFLPVDSIETGKPIWTTWLNMCIDESKAKQVKVEDNGKEISYDISNQFSKIKSAHFLTKWLKLLPYKLFANKLIDIKKQIGEEMCRRDIGVMTWNDIADTLRDLDYQSHTMTHPILGNIEEEEVLDFELGKAKEIIENKTGAITKFISYPVGSYSDKVLKSAKKYYEAGFAVDGKLVNLNKIENPDYKYCIPRFNVSDSDPFELFFRVNGFHKLFGR